MPLSRFPTDAQSPLMAAASLAEGSSIFIENIFESRYKHVPELQRMARTSKWRAIAVVHGVRELHSASVRCTDLRGGAAIAAAALARRGKGELLQIEHIDRGYEHLNKPCQHRRGYPPLKIAAGEEN
jgi:UDP-N-acetylglucosamine 1-carboxyvinyltransferase